MSINDLNPLKIRLWGRAIGGKGLTPVTFSSSLDNPDLFIKCLNDCEYGWIIVVDPTDPNKLTQQELIDMAKEIINHNGVQLLLTGQDKQGNKVWLSQSFHLYQQRIMSVDWNRLGSIAAKPPIKPVTVSTEARDALEAAKAEIEANKTVPHTVKALAEKYNGSAKIPAVLLKKIEEWYSVELIDGVYSINPVDRKDV